MGDITVNIKYDSFPCDPREWDNLATLVLFHPKYNLGDKDHRYTIDNYTSWDELYNEIVENENPAVIVPVSMYEHSGIMIRTGIPSQFIDYRWDAMYIGFAFITRDTVKQEYGWININKARRDKLESIIDAEVNTYSEYVNGEVFAFEIFDNEIDDVVDSCYGFYGFEYCKREALDSANSLVKQEA